MLMAASTGKTTTAALATTRSTYGISENCTCSFEKLPGGKDGCVNVKDSSYPDHENLRITDSCLPDIPDK